MRALAKSDIARLTVAEAVVSDLTAKGMHRFEHPVDPARCAALLSEVRATRRFDESLFLSEAEFDADRQHAGGDRGPGRNLLERLTTRTDFVERSPQIAEALWSLLGPDYKILDRRLVCEAPARSVPSWVKRQMHADVASSLDRYVRPAYRDIAYSCGADFHQDLIGHPDRSPDFVTVCIYLHPVTAADAPVHVLEGSHRLGGSAFPHDLKRTGPDSWRYRNGRYGEMPVTERVLTGEAGFAAMWHACTLHGAQPDAADHERISLRYLLARGGAESAGIDAVNASLAGPLSLTDTRQDPAPGGWPAIRHITAPSAA
jgi:hypothetical protein